MRKALMDHTKTLIYALDAACEQNGARVPEEVAIALERYCESVLGVFYRKDSGRVESIKSLFEQSEVKTTTVRAQKNKHRQSFGRWRKNRDSWRDSLRAKLVQAKEWEDENKTLNYSLLSKKFGAPLLPVTFACRYDVNCNPTEAQKRAVMHDFKNKTRHMSKLVVSHEISSIALGDLLYVECADEIQEYFKGLSRS